MKRQLILCTSLFILMPACQNSAKDTEIKAEQAQRQADDKAAKSQKEANDKMTKAQNEANEKAAQAQKEADEKMMKANDEAQHDMAKGQAKANETIRQANTDIVKQRNDFHASTQKEVSEIDNKIDDLKVKAQKSSTKPKAEFSDAMKVVDSKRATLDSDLRRIDTEGAQTFDSYR